MITIPDPQPTVVFGGPSVVFGGVTTTKITLSPEAYTLSFFSAAKASLGAVIVHDGTNWKVTSWMPGTSTDEFDRVIRGYWMTAIAVAADL